MCAGVSRDGANTQEITGCPVSSITRQSRPTGRYTQPRSLVAKVQPNSKGSPLEPRDDHRGGRMTSTHDFTATAADGTAVPLADYAGKVLLIVNVASKC